MCGMGQGEFLEPSPGKVVDLTRTMGVSRRVYGKGTSCGVDLR